MPNANPQHSQEITRLLAVVEEASQTSDAKLVKGLWSKIAEPLKEVAKRFDVYTDTLLGVKQPDTSTLSKIAKDLRELNNAIQDLEIWLQDLSQNQKKLEQGWAIKLDRLKKAREKVNLRDTLTLIFVYIEGLKTEGKRELSPEETTYYQGNRASIVEVLNQLVNDLRRIARN